MLAGVLVVFPPADTVVFGVPLLWWEVVSADVVVVSKGESFNVCRWSSLSSLLLNTIAAACSHVGTLIAAI